MNEHKLCTVRPTEGLATSAPDPTAAAGAAGAAGAAAEAAEAAEIKKRSVVIAGHRTSISLENAFWDALRDIAAARATSVNQLVTEIDRGRRGNLSSAIRTYVLLSQRPT